MKASSKLQKEIILKAIEANVIKDKKYKLNTDLEIKLNYKKIHQESYCFRDFINEFRHKGERSNVPAPFSRYFESKSIAYKLVDGSWVGWTYWYGGGKYAYPENIDWVEECYNLKLMKQKRKIITIKKFEKT